VILVTHYRFTLQPKRISRIVLYFDGRTRLSPRKRSQSQPHFAQGGYDGSKGNVDIERSGDDTKALLVCSLVAGPLYVIVGLIQVVIRPGFDITRHDLSLMSNGDLGWIQIANFLVTGLLIISGSIGMRRVLTHGRSRMWGPLLIGIYGLGVIGAGIFSADPAMGFPPGPPVDAHAISWHGLLHFVTGGIGFLALIAACIVFARRFAALRRTGWTVYSTATGVVFFAAFAGIASGPGQPWIVVSFWIAVILAWAWISAISIRLIMERSEGTRGGRV
jgi:hypothetical protein